MDRDRPARQDRSR